MGCVDVIKLIGMLMEFISALMLFSGLFSMNKIQNIDIRRIIDRNNFTQHIDNIISQINEVVDKYNKHKKTENEKNKKWIYLFFIGFLIQFLCELYFLFFGKYFLPKLL